MIYKEPPNDRLDGMCDPDLQPIPTQDKDIDGVVLFADINPADIEAVADREDEWRRLFGVEDAG